MSFEEQISGLNELYFYREFTFSKTTFRPNPTDEFELADSVVWLDDLLILFQLKEREVSGQTTPEAERNWFERKVMGRATRQIRDTLSYLKKHQQITLKNHRDHEFILKYGSIATVHRVICYLAHQDLPDSSRQQKAHVSRSAGFMHLIAATEYLRVLETLRTPAEVSEYLDFRQSIISSAKDATEMLSEDALLGQYLSGELKGPPREDYVEYLTSLDQRAQEWDMSKIIEVFKERVTTPEAGTQYYPILREVAKLNRIGLHHFKQRFTLSFEKARADEFARPYRFADLGTQCGFVFVPLMKLARDKWENLLKNSTTLHKYSLKLPKCVGVCFFADEDDRYNLNWCYIEYAWESNKSLEEALEKSNPFRDVQEKRIGGYSFEADA